MVADIQYAVRKLTNTYPGLEIMRMDEVGFDATLFRFRARGGHMERELRLSNTRMASMYTGELIKIFQNEVRQLFSPPKNTTDAIMDKLGLETTQPESWADKWAREHANG